MGDDEADTEVFYDLLKCLYAHHPIRTHIAGTQESISHITDQTLYACHRAFYNPANMVLSVVGNVDPQKVMDIAREIVTAPGMGSPERDYGQEEPPAAVSHETSRTMAVSSPLFQMGFKLPVELGEKRLRAKLVAELAGDLLLGDSSPLYVKLYEEGLLTRAFSYGYEDYPGCAFFALGGESRDPWAVRDQVLAVCAELGERGFEEARFQRLKKAAYGEVVSQLNSFENSAVDLAQGYFDGVDYLTFPEVFQTITAQEVQDFIIQNFTADNAALAVITPGGGEP